MLDLLYHFFNYVISGCYFVIFLLIFTGLLKQGVLGHNPLGTATSGIFLTCSLGHLVHATTSHIAGDVWQAGVQVIIDGWTILPAIAYLIMRRRYGLIIRGPDMINEFKLQVAQQANQIKLMQEVEQLKDDFLAMASHELRTPLTTVKGYAQYLSKQLDNFENKRIVLAVNTINQQVDRMTSLIGMLLDVSRIQSGKLQMQPVLIQLNQFLSELIERLQITSSTHSLVLELSNSPVWVKMDVERLEQVVNNLVSNAIKYSPGAERVLISVASDANNVSLRVEDFGKGISPQELPHIFDRFYRSPSVKNSTMQGLGLGLYICHEIIKASNGEITVTSTLNVGSTFTVTLPNVSSEVKFNPVPLEQSAS